ncbi:MAG: S1 RNA-binding domain-containing protein [Elusimicrobia bacterium]|nr:S1 RNA-binding domain-containing protein [Elusimicrobiota bacterium]
METNETQQNPNGGKNPENEEASGHNEEELSMEQLLAAETEVSAKLYSRDIVKVKVVQITEQHVLVDIGEKKEAVIPIDDFKEEKTPEVGAEVPAMLERKGGEGKYTVLSHRKAREKMAWQWAGKMFEAKERVKGRVAEAVKGGYIVDLAGLRAFMPLSLSEISGAHKHYLPDNAKIKCYITNFSASDRRIVVSRRQALEEDEKERRASVLGEISPGCVVRAVASKVAADGMSVRFQGIEGFIRVEDVAWKKPEAELKTCKRGQRIKCKVLAVDRENEKIFFGIKQLTPNPVDLLKKRFPYRAVLRVKVAAVSKDGAKVKISEHVEGFISAAEYSYESGAPKEGQELKMILIGINPATCELTLSMKKLEELEDRKKIQSYLKGAPTLTLGQILLENSEDEGEV